MGCAFSGADAAAVGAKTDTQSVEFIASGDFHAQYIMFDKLGNGAFGSVYRAAPATSKHEQRAAKVVDVRDDASRESGFWDSRCRTEASRFCAYQNEVRALRKLTGHINICQIHGKAVHGGLAYIVLEYCDRSLWQALERIPALSEATLLPYFRGMLKGLSFAHARGVVHRDVKPDNFMCAGPQDTVKLCDFGLACCVSPAFVDGENVCSGVYGTAPFMPPEMLMDRPYGVKVDSWSFGVIVYVLCFGRFPYIPQRPTSQDMKRAIVEGSPAPTFSLASAQGPSAVSMDLVRWARKLLTRDPVLRPSCHASLDEYLFNSPAASTSSLRSMLHSAKRCGAFGGSSGTLFPATTLDVRLQELQGRYRAHALSTCNRMEPASEDSTSIGSPMESSG